MSSLQRCSRCVLDTTIPDLTFDENGTCNYCRHFEVQARLRVPSDPMILADRLSKLVDRIKSDGRGKRYDCVVGVSGGADSSYALYLAKKNGLRPLAVHMDNGWDSELAVSNIDNLVTRLGVDLHTHVINWTEYRRLMQSFFDADVLDVELLYDNAMLAVNYQQAARIGVRWILGGTNTSTEGMQMPVNWNWFKYDERNIQSLAKRSKVPIRTFPSIGTIKYAKYRGVYRIRWLPFLDYINYVKSQCVRTLREEVGFREYPYKHYESIFTRFYQAYILPKKFGIDKRKLHLSTLVLSGQMSREEALADLMNDPYPSAADRENDVEYFLKKMGWSRSQLDEYIRRPEVSHARYGTERPLWDAVSEVAKRLNIVERHADLPKS